MALIRKHLGTQPGITKFWTPLDFGKHKGKTLPQVIFADPDWFFWAVEKGTFKNRERLLTEARDIDRKARFIRIPQTGTERMVAEYRVDRTSHKYSNLEIVPESRPRDSGFTERLHVLDLSFPRRQSKYDKSGGSSLLSSVKEILFDGKVPRMTKKRCEEFFNDNSRFDL